MNILESLSNFFISSAQAAPAGAPPGAGASNFSLVLMLVVFLVFIYMTVWRPQSKRAKEQREMLSAISKGDEVVTIGGIIGKVNKITDNYILLAIADNVEIPMQKSSIANPLPKGTIKSI